MSEVNALKTLRETTLAYLSQSDYEKILKAVEVGGIESLTGTAAMVVKSAVLKHGSHDQSTHNPKKGGGGGGGSGSGTGSDYLDGMNDAVVDAQEDIANRIKGAESQRGRTRPSGSGTMRPQDAQTEQRIEGTIKGYKDAGALIGKPKELSKLKGEMVRAKKDIRTPSYYMRPDNAFVDGYADSVIQVHSAYGTLDLGGEPVRKHGSHDQSSHNPKKGGGGAGGGGGSGSPSTLDSTHIQEMAKVERDVRGAASGAAGRGGGMNDPYIGPPTKAAVSAANSIEKARSAKTIEEAENHIEIAKFELNTAFEQYENENFHDAARVMFDAGKNLTSIMTAAKRGMPVTPIGGGGASIIDLTFPGGTFGD